MQTDLHANSGFHNFHKKKMNKLIKVQLIRARILYQGSLNVLNGAATMYMFQVIMLPHVCI